MKEKIWAVTLLKDEIEKMKGDVVEFALSRAAAAIGFYAITNPYASVQWIGNEMEEKNGNITVLVEIEVEGKPNPQYEERTEKKSEYEFIG